MFWSRGVFFPVYSNGRGKPITVVGNTHWRLDGPLCIFATVGTHRRRWIAPPTLQQTPQCDTITVNELNKVNIMSDQELSTRSNHALWLAIGVMLVPLVPYALSGAGG
jgi:hypothetical protein